MSCVELNRRRLRQLLWYLGGFLVVQAALAVGVERFWPLVRDPEYASRAGWLRHWLARGPRRPLVIGLGSSRLLQGLDAASLSVTPDETGAPAPLVFNFGVGGGGPMMENVLLRRLLAVGVRPDLLVVEIVPMGLNQRNGKTVEERFLDPARLRLDEAALVAGRYCQRPEVAWPRWLLARVLPSYRHQAELHRALSLSLGVDVHRGYDPGDFSQLFDDHGWGIYAEPVTPERLRRQTAFVLGQYEDSMGHFRPAARVEQAYRDLLDLCRRERVPVVLVLMPDGKPFRAGYSPEARAGIASTIRGLASDHGVPVIDASAWLDSFPGNAFWDSIHLNRDGAVVFSERLGREVVRPLLRHEPIGTTADRTAFWLSR